MIYLDSCSLIKLIRAEAESAGLRAWLAERASTHQLTSELAHAEVPRVVRRSNHTDLGRPIDPDRLSLELSQTHRVLTAVRCIALDRALLTRAGELGDPMIRALDAIHLASALELDVPDLEFVTYDRRLAHAAKAAGLRVAAPA